MIFIEANPQPVKFVLHDKGLIGPGIRLPLLPLSEKHTLYEAVYRAVCRSVSLSAIAPRQQKEVCHIGPQRRELCRP